MTAHQQVLQRYEAQGLQVKEMNQEIEDLRQQLQQTEYGKRERGLPPCVCAATRSFARSPRWEQEEVSHIAMDDARRFNDRGRGEWDSERKEAGRHR